ncbi:MAG: hypothetical protein JOY78_18850 [Pseudonocardia sp.]|nr:hypothetical protein [Pseudonocardia sp.]
MSSGVQKQRANLYGVDGAVDAAIAWAKSNTTLGSVDDGTCQGNAGQFFNTVNSAGTPISVTCTAATDSGGAGGITTAPNFAILTLAPYHGAAPGGGGGYPGCVNTHDELGIVQVQKSKLLQIYGNVYVNSDADSDIYDTTGCPSTLAALPMVVYGNVIERESNHDFCAGPTNLGDPQCDPYINAGGPPLPSPQGTAPYTDTAPLASPNAAQSALLADPGLPANDPSGMWQPNFLNAPAAGVITDANNNVISTCPAADPGSGYRLIKFSAGTYSNAAVLNGFTNGGCPNAVLWFQPGDYYFNFTDAGTSSPALHQWTINDTGIRVIGGQPFSGTSSFPMLSSSTWKPTVASSSPASGNNSWGTPDAAKAIDGAPTTATVVNGGTATLNLGTFKSSAGTSIPADAQINSVRLRVAHGEGSTALLQAPKVTITPGTGGAACTVVGVNPRQGAPVEDSAPNYDVFNISGAPCLNDVSKINDSMKLTYSVSHCTGTANGCTTASTTDSVDGIWMDITYTTGGRLAWSPFDPASITPSSPTVPGACMSDRDSGSGWTKGVQFVFGGDSHVQLKSGKVELCDAPSVNKQEISVYGVRAATPTQVGPVTWTPQTITNGSTGFTNVTNGRVIDGSSASATLSSSTARTATLTQFSPSTWPIPAANQIPAGSTINSVTLKVAHSESSSSQVATPTYTVTPAASANCTGLAALTRHTGGIATDSIDVTACLNTLAKINGGVTVGYSVARSGSSGSPTANLDGMSLAVTYTPPAQSTGNLNGASGCVTKAPYYTPPTPGNPNLSHEPAYNGSCALFQVATDSAGGSFPRTLTIWGTVYAPSAALDVPVDVMTVPVFNRGVVARMMMLGYNIANNAIVPITTTPNAGFVARNRHMTLAAKVGTTSVTADVKICDYADTDTGPTGCASGDGSVKVLSWKATH